MEVFRMKDEIIKPDAKYIPKCTAAVPMFLSLTISSTLLNLCKIAFSTTNPEKIIKKEPIKLYAM